MYMTNIRLLAWSMHGIFDANDLPPLVLGTDRNVVEEEFWRLLMMDLRSVDATFMFVYEKTDYRHFISVLSRRF
ncbi:hypothetical protein [Methermicoccus shengliensis]|uniref:Uncharacterized protein n=1 Tax=Methermicoccus shengliensis TaxID=660064 RepID=A0A832W078_9EURY|nr:hypothetical protein [Methermicoccus shengliensis]KUK03993.1 MAG: hypothetical protein XD46_1289 [Euryarchaeota archaeon 55_53]KUK29538.1 MAG: hypothetical protein XD62_1374 [Methanosarcinales archeaon 56_1174]MDI3487611.1 hypothetical protein [Methanosarcinales archaeon]MDN5294944.1 hypothetical protein [Methanosarcinales archaeon]HIH69950.1 hypothetical protein [Methermicoccus shengliensis]